MHRSLIVCLLLSGAVAAVYGQTLHFEFLRWDDPPYVYENTNVRAGVTAKGLRWAFTKSHAANYHPLTWVSHMLDCERYGLNPAGHHAGNVLLHILNTLLLFGVLRAMTAAFLPSAAVAALFGLHPLHVESVAWVAERKDVLSTCFGLLAIGAYAAYARRPSFGRYSRVFLLFAATLAAKPMLVTLPLLLLLLDFWPLNRMQTRGDSPSWGVLLVEKLPLLALSAASCVVTYVVQQGAGASEPTRVIAAPGRAANAVVSYVRYLGKTFWPTDLSPHYHHPNLPGGTPWAVWQVACAAGVLLAVTAVAVAAHRRRHLLVGWLWYLGSLVPVIGLVQVGHQAMADRYTYVPLIGPFLAVVWAAADAAAKRNRRGTLVALATVVLVACGAVSAAQARHWRRSEALFERGLEVEPRNPVMHSNLAQIRRGQGRIEDSMHHFEQSLLVRPSDPKALINLGGLLFWTGNVEAAITHYRTALDIMPRSYLAHYNLAFALASTGRTAEAVDHYREALRIRSDEPLAHLNLGVAFESLGKVDQAIHHYQTALRLQPTMAEARTRLDRASKLGDGGDAAP